MNRASAIIGLICVLILAVLAIKIVLLAFAALLLSILLSTVADWIHPRLGIRPNSAAVLVVVLLCTITVAGIWMFGVSMAGQLEKLSDGVAQAQDQLWEQAQKYDWSRRLWPRAREQGEEAFVSNATIAVATAVQGVAATIFVLFLALYLSLERDRYWNAVIRFIPTKKRRKAVASMEAITHALRWWILGQMISMVVVAVVTTIGLLALDVPLPFTLGCITGVLNFIPNVGAILSALLAGGLALTKGASVLLSVLLLYVVIQSLEGYILTPFIQKQTVHLPPALTIFVQALMSIWIGALGLALAAPATVVALVLTRSLYFRQEHDEVEGERILKSAG